MVGGDVDTILLRSRSPHNVMPSSARRVRPHEDQEVAHNAHACICQLHCQSRASCCIFRPLLYLSTLVVCSMSCTDHQRASATQSSRQRKSHVNLFARDVIFCVREGHARNDARCGQELSRSLDSAMCIGLLPCF